MDDVLDLLACQQGHFLLESGHHGDLWIDLESLCLNPARLRPLVSTLAKRLSQWNVEVICGPLIEGAFIALLVASELGVGFTYSKPFSRPVHQALFPVGYQLPGALRKEVQGRRVAIVNDVINAGSAVRGTFSDLETCGAEIVGIAALLVPGTAVSQFATSMSVPFETLATAPNHLWTPESCPLCALGVSLIDLTRLDSHASKKSSNL